MGTDTGESALCCAIDSCWQSARVVHCSVMSPTRSCTGWWWCCMVLKLRKYLRRRAYVQALRLQPALCP